MTEDEVLCAIIAQVPIYFTFDTTDTTGKHRTQSTTVLQYINGSPHINAEESDYSGEWRDTAWTVSDAKEILLTGTHWWSGITYYLTSSSTEMEVVDKVRNRLTPPQDECIIVT